MFGMQMPGNSQYQSQAETVVCDRHISIVCKVEGHDVSRAAVILSPRLTKSGLCILHTAMHIHCCFLYRIPPPNPMAMLTHQDHQTLQEL